MQTRLAFPKTPVFRLCSAFLTVGLDSRTASVCRSQRKKAPKGVLIL